MAFLTDTKLKSVIDLPIALANTTIKQSDYVVVATVKVQAAQRLSLRSLTLQLLDTSIDLSQLTPANKIVPNLGLAYAVLRKDYSSGTPGNTGALDFIFQDVTLGVATRTGAPTVLTVPGNYSIIVANNMQATTASNVPTDTSIDFKVVVTGQFRLELSVA